MAKLSLRNLSLLAALLILVSWAIMTKLRPAEELVLQGTTIQPPAPLAAFTLADSEGQPFGPSQLLGHWTVMSLGFTHCPDICPTTLAYFRDELQALPAGKSVQFVFVGVDPERDPPVALGQFVHTFHPQIKAVTGEPSELKAFAAIFHAYFQKEGQTKEGLYSLAHSPQYFLINPQGQWEVLYTPPMAKGALALDLQKLAQDRS